MPNLSKTALLALSLVIVGGILIIYCIKTANSFFLPCLVAILTAFGLGILEPQKGWKFALLEVAILWVGYWAFTNFPDNETRQSVELLALGISTVIAFACSALIGFVRRA
ncbi:hypothetical protein [Siphonobacter sp.]|uniref:hypothetical protein n=1 Tax=Siphonobacter sp. TaxID=1869184 RepID=UPI003B3A980B